MSATVTSIATPTGSQKAALEWVNLHKGPRPSTPTLRLVAQRGWITEASKDAVLTAVGRVLLGLDPVEQPKPRPQAKDTKPAPELSDANGRSVKVGDRITITSKGNNVRKQDVGATGTVRGTTRTRLLVDWGDTPNHMAPRWPVLPALVTVQV